MIRMKSFLSKWIILTLDLAIATVAFGMTTLICFSLMQQELQGGLFMVKWFGFTGVLAIFFLAFKTNQSIIRYTTFKDILHTFNAILCAHVVLWGFNEGYHWLTGSFFFRNYGLIISFTLTFSLIIAKKVAVMLLFDVIGGKNGKNGNQVPMLVYGVSMALVEGVRMLLANPAASYRIRGFITTTRDAANKKLQNLPVYPEGDDLEALLDEHRIGALLINPTELDRNEKQQIADICIRKKVELLSLPPVNEWKDQEKKSVKMKKIRIEDLLGRVPIQIDVTSIGKALKGKTIMITGAAGSIGSEIVRQIGHFEPGLVLLCDSAETPMHNLRLELEEKYPCLSFLPFVVDVRNDRSMAHLFKTYHPHYIYHAAAYKHVPLMEECPNEAVMTNVWGTKVMVDLAIRYKAEAFVMISTDKAVNPTNVMGCSKRIAEIYVQSKAVQPEITWQTRFITTRFGNVLGSNGSVIPHFREQIEKGGPVTVTHKEIIRYFMTIPEACRLVLEAGNMAKGGEIFVFDMGEPVKIADLARKMIRLAGFEPDVDIPIIYTGLRPGEKLYEELLNNAEETKPTHNRKIKIGKVREYANYQGLQLDFQALIESARSYETMSTVRLMKAIVPEFISNNSRFEALDNEEAIQEEKVIIQQ